jgi:hypothetical protein
MPPFDYQAAAQERQRSAKMLRDAAPDLFAALENLLADCEAHGLTDNDAHLREARAAITKAQGA